MPNRVEAFYGRTESLGASKREKGRDPRSIEQSINPNLKAGKPADAAGQKKKCGRHTEKSSGVVGPCGVLLVPAALHHLHSMSAQPFLRPWI
jgi:hypothetical protein